MSTISIKVGGRIITKNNISKNLIKKAMDEVMQEHPHLCGNCGSNACSGSRNIQNEIVVRGVETPSRNYIFECLAFRKMTQEDRARLLQRERESECSHSSRYFARTASLSELTPEDIDAMVESLPDEEEEMLDTRREFDEEYGSLLDSIKTPFVYFKKRR